ncbi:unnamed protein product [Lepidochelys olivacea]
MGFGLCRIHSESLGHGSTSLDTKDRFAGTLQNEIDKFDTVQPILASFLFCSFLRALISTYPCKLIGILPKQEVMKRTLRGRKSHA